MKALLPTLFLLLLSTLAGRAQEVAGQLPIDARTKLITYSAVVPTPGVTQANLLVRAKAWANRVSVPTKPPQFLNEMGTDVVIAPVSQQLVPDATLNTYRLYFVAQVSLREGRYQYRFDEFTFEFENGTLHPAEGYVLDAPSDTKSDRRTTVKVRTQFEQAVAQAAAIMQESLLTPLVPLNANGTDW